MEIALLIIVILLVAALGVLGFKRATTQARLKESERQLAEAQHKLEHSQASLKEAEVDNAAHKARLEALTKTHEEQATRFKGIAAEVAKENSETFLRQAKEQFESHQKQSDASLKERQVAIDELVRPVGENFEKFKKQIEDMESKRTEAYGGLKSEVSNMQTAANDLMSALKVNHIRGQWGETQLRTVLELSGLRDGINYSSQMTIKAENTSIRPDVVVNIPNDLKVVIDAKTPFTSYLDAHKEEDDERRKKHLVKHARSLMGRAAELSKKDYKEAARAAVGATPEFVLMFVPSDAILDAAMEVEDKLWEEIWEKHNVLIVSPGLLLAFLKTVAVMWQQQDLERNAKEIAKGASDLYDSLRTYLKHVNNMGKGLEQAVKSYNSSIGSLESRVLPRARKFDGWGVASESQQISPPTSSFSSVRSLSAPEHTSFELEADDDGDS